MLYARYRMVVLMSIHFVVTFAVSAWSLLGTQELWSPGFLGSRSEACDERKGCNGIAI